MGALPRPCRYWDGKIFANLAGKAIVDLPVAGYRGSLTSGVAPEAVIPALAQKLGAVRLEMPLKVAALHAATTSSMASVSLSR